ncbi:MAG: YgjV family protein [Clostridia bacterium]|nr:YgjV family protein [Clostridia bacterium]
MIEIIAQIIGIFGTCSMFLSFQIKKNSTFFVVQCLSGLFFALNFLLLGAYTGSIFNFINILRGSVLAGGKKYKKIYFLVLLQLLYVLTVVFTFNGWLSILSLIAQLVGTFAMWTQNGKIIRFGQLLCVSPIWLIHNIFVFSIGGIICEVFSIISIIVSLIRFGINGFDK